MAAEQRHNKSIFLGLLLHNHQPVGNFSWVFQQIYDESYLPMIEALEKHPGVRLSLHYTGSLLDWIEATHAEFLHRVAALVERGQIEMVGGAYYEPILPAIPDVDKVAQIRRQARFTKQHFGREPTGMWLAERVWEPGLPRFLRAAGVEWTILDDVHFKSAGLGDDDLLGYYVTEDQGYAVKIYATSKYLRYTIPWRAPIETIESLRSLATEDGKRILVMGDDGEKFGSWPGTQQYCWGANGQRGWVEQFFALLEENADWLHTIPLGEYAQVYPALGRLYLPTSSYIEMTEWALPPKKAYLFEKLLRQFEDEKREDVLQFMRGGFWRNFLARYTEVNNQHKKMLRVHRVVHSNGGHGSPEEDGRAPLWKAQANDTYWHGLFGGVYMAHVRSAVYHHLIQAENAAARVKYGADNWQTHELTDFDCDGQDELIIEGNRQNLYVDLQRGGTLFEWDMRRSEHNVLCVMTRREESYHRTLREYEEGRRRSEAEWKQASSTEANIEPASPHTTVRTKEPDLDRYLVIDRYRRDSFIDHFLMPSTTLAEFARGQFEEQGNFVEQPYVANIQQDDVGITVTMSREGYVKRAGALGPVPVRLSKQIFVPRGEEKLVARYTIRNRGQSRLQTQFGCEWNMHLLGGGNDQAYYRIEGNEVVHGGFDSTGVVEDARMLHVGNKWLQQDMQFSLSEAARLWRFSIETVTGSEAGFERTHQGSCFTLIWPVVIESDGAWSVEITCLGSQAS